MQPAEPTPLSEIAAIRALMERSSRFVSLSGWSGVSAGLVAVLGALAAYFRLQSFGLDPVEVRQWRFIPRPLVVEVYGIGLITLALAAILATFFTWRRTNRSGYKLSNPVTRRLFWAMALPLVMGMIFCFLLERYGAWVLVVPASMIFYGLGLVGSAKYTLNEVFYLGLLFCGLGILCALIPQYAFYCWIGSFGGLHILYGIYMLRYLGSENRRSP